MNNTIGGVELTEIWIEMYRAHRFKGSIYLFKYRLKDTKTVV